MFEAKELILIRVFTSDKYKFKGKVVYQLLVEDLLKNNISGATVLHGILGFGKEKIIHSAGVLDISEKLPVIIEICETEENLEKVLTIIKNIFSQANINGFITYEKVKSIIFKREKK